VLFLPHPIAGPAAWPLAMLFAVRLRGGCGGAASPPHWRKAEGREQGTAPPAHPLPDLFVSVSVQCPVSVSGHWTLTDTDTVELKDTVWRGWKHGLEGEETRFEGGGDTVWRGRRHGLKGEETQFGGGGDAV